MLVQTAGFVQVVLGEEAISAPHSLALQMTGHSALVDVAAGSQVLQRRSACIGGRQLGNVVSREAT